MKTLARRASEGTETLARRASKGQIRVKNRPKSLQLVEAVLAQSPRDVPDFLSRTDGPPPEGHVLRLPEAGDVSIPVQPHLIVELCSK